MTKSTQNKYLYFLYFIIIIMFLLNTLTANKIRQLSQTETPNENTRFNDDSLEALLWASKLELSCENRLINNVITTSAKGESDSLKEIIGETPKLIFRFSYLNCNACINQQIEFINEFSNLIGEKSIIILASNILYKNLPLFIKENNISCSCYAIKEKELKLELEGANTPYYFIIDNNFVARDVFVPIKSLPSHTRDYFQEVSKRLNKDYNSAMTN